MEINTNKENLEKALTSLGNETKETTSNKAIEAPKLSKEEEIGFHKGALNTLLAERNEIIKMVANVEAIMQAHLKRLQELGVKIEIQKPKEVKK